MKKILSFLIVLGALTFINVDLFAYSYDDPVANQGVITIDTQLTILNNNSLKDVFEIGNIYQYIVNDGTINELEYEYEITNIATFTRIRPNNNLNINAEHYLSFDTYISQPITLLWVFTNGSNYASFSYNLNEWTNVQYRWNNTSNELFAPYYYDSGTLNNDFLLLRNALLIDLDYWGITNLSNSEIDYFYQLYQILRLGLDPSIYYNQGYDNGYDDGYDAGNLQGYSDGYDEGLFDYHTGNNYGSYDFTLSEPYDQATQANISLLNIFSMIIGVAMSMLGFIINIDIFGISIASILGTLAIGVSIVWLLKLIRG